MAAVRLTEADSHREVAVSSGDTVDVRLAENPTTGYSWHAETDPPGALTLEADRFVSAAAGAQPGAGGVRVLSFRTAAHGKVKLRLKLRREWESTAPAKAQFDFAIEVR